MGINSDSRQRKRLAALGWRFGTIEEFLGLDAKAMQKIDQWIQAENLLSRRGKHQR